MTFNEAVLALRALGYTHYEKDGVLYRVVVAPSNYDDFVAFAAAHRSLPVFNIIGDDSAIPYSRSGDFKIAGLYTDELAQSLTDFTHFDN